MKIAIIGGGNLGTAIAEGLVISQFSKPADIIVTKRNLATIRHLKERKINISSDNVKAVKNSDVIILAVKPFQVAAVIEEIKKELQADKLLISVVTGFAIAEIDSIINRKLPVFRAMPNTAIAIRQSMTCVCSRHADEKQIKFVNDLFSTVGKVVTIDEQLMEAATILGACGTAYAMRYIRASIQGGIEIGFDAVTASLIAAQTVKGAAELLLVNGSHP
jgi:pyrroline-5-carboxylate reductase